MRQFTRPIKAIPPKSKKSKTKPNINDGLITIKDESNEDYHKTSIDPMTGQPYQSSSTIKSILESRLYKSHSAAMALGTSVHSIIENIIAGENYVYGQKTTITQKVALSGPTVEENQYILRYADDVKTLDAMLPRVIQYLDGHVCKNSEIKYIEKSIYISGAYWRSKIPRHLFPDSLAGLLDFVIVHNMPIKIRCDLLYRGLDKFMHIVDWKTTSDATLSGMAYSVNKYKYPLSLLLYSLGACAAFGPVGTAMCVFLPKTKGENSVLVEAGMDLERDKSKIQHYLKDLLPGKKQWEQLIGLQKTITKEFVITTNLFGE